MKLILTYFREAVRKFPKQFLAAMSMIAVLTLLESLMPWGLRIFLDHLTADGGYSILIGGIVLFAAYLLVQVFVNIARFAALDRFGGRYIEYLSLSLEQAMAQTTYSEIEKLRPNVIRNVLYTDVLNIFRAIGHCIPSMLGALAVVCATVGLGFCYDIRASAFILASASLGLLLSWASRRIVAKYAGQTNTKLKTHDAWCTQFVEMLPQIQCDNLLAYYQEKTRDNLRDFIATSIREDKTIYFWTGLVSGYHSLFSIALSALLAIPAAGGSVPNLVFFTLIANLTMGQAQTLESLFQQCTRYFVSFTHVENLRRLPRRAGTKQTEAIRTVDFENVSFAYPGGVQALRNVSCHLEAGNVVHLKGGNGSGKSTFVKLLAGLYAPNQGRILLNGEPMGDFSQETLNRKILYISQDEKFLNETFHKYLEIITGRSISQEEYHRLIELVGLPADEREISENGSSLSVGQRKKLLMVKALLNQDEASVVILDEVTAGLDRETTALFRTWLAQAAERRDKIILTIDHTMPETSAKNTYLVFQNGEVKCTG